MNGATTSGHNLGVGDLGAGSGGVASKSAIDKVKVGAGVGNISATPT